MKISIITVSYNSAATIRDTILSVQAQTYKPVEYIIVDGKSKDDTAEIIQSFGAGISQFISEPDKGLYDAMNKGIKMASGEVIGILNSDDFYSDDQVLSDVMALFKPGIDAVYADLVYVDPVNTSKVVRTWHSGAYRNGAFKKGWMPPHPTFFVRRELYEKFGGFTDQLKSAADYEIMLRFIHKEKINLAYLPRVIVSMRAGGASNASLKNRLNANREDRMAWKMNGLKPGAFTFIRKPLSKIGQFFKK